MVVRGSAWRAAIWTSRSSTPASSMVVAEHVWVHPGKPHARRAVTGQRYECCVRRTANRSPQRRVVDVSQLLDAQHTRQHRKSEMAVGGFGPAREESADPVERGVSLLV